VTDTRTFSSELAADPDAVWRYATSLHGINLELAPFRMTAPPGLRSFADAGDRWPNGVPVGEFLFTSWVLLGPLAVDRMRIRLVELDLEGRRFVESSDVLSMRLWRHERAVRATAQGCILQDTWTFEPRLRPFRSVLRTFVGRVFPRRHAGGAEDVRHGVTQEMFKNGQLLPFHLGEAGWATAPVLAEDRRVPPRSARRTRCARIRKTHEEERGASPAATR